MGSHLTEPDPGLARLVAATPHGMMFWSGTGPAGATCGRCLNFGYHDEKGRRHKNGCALYFAHMNAHGRKPLPESTPACRYFESAERA
jgi:hypothetical protein